MNALRLDEVHTTFPDQWVVSFALLQEKVCLARCVSLNFVFARFSDTQDRFRHVHHMELTYFQQIAEFPPDLSLSVLWECSRTEPPDCGERILQTTWADIDRCSTVDHHQSVFVTFATRWLKVISSTVFQS